MSKSLAELMAQLAATGPGADVVDSLVDELRRQAASARGPDWREQSWDSYRWEQYEREAWGVTIPFAALAFAQSPVVPVAAAERLLALPTVVPDHPWERPPPGLAYRRYWSSDKRFLALVAEIASRWPTDTDHLQRPLQRQISHLPQADRDTMLLACAALGLTNQQPLELAREVLAHARADELGARGVLVQAALNHTDQLASERRADLLAEALTIARRTTPFLAANPFAACVEAMADGAAGGPSELIELVERALQLKLADWPGWQSALHAGGRAVQGLARNAGLEAVHETVRGLSRIEAHLPGLVPWFYVCGARGLTGAEQSQCLQASLAAARRTSPTVYGLRAEALAVRLLTEAHAEEASGELDFTLRRLSTAAQRRRHQAGCLAAVVELAELPEATDRCLEVSELLRGVRRRWVALTALAANCHSARSAQLLSQASRLAGLWLIKPPHWEVLTVVWAALGLTHGPRTRAARAVARLVAAAELHDWSHRTYARELAALGALLPLEVLPSIVEVAAQPVGWWRLPLLAMIADCVAAHLVDRQPRPRRAVRTAGADGDA